MVRPSCGSNGSRIAFAEPITVVKRRTLAYSPVSRGSGSIRRSVPTARFRRARSRLASAWLLCQAAVLAVSLVLMCADKSDAAEHHCTHGDHASCPMHHRADPTRTGWTRCGGETQTAVFCLLQNEAGPEPAQGAVIVHAAAAVLSGGDCIDLSRRSAPPDPPPPQA